MWMDVFGSISLCRSPRFLALYQTLFVPGALDTMSGQSIETNMDRVMGCPNEIILAFAQIAHLEARKGDLVKRLNNGLGMSGPANMPPGYPPGAPGWGYMPPDSPELWRQEMESLETEGIQIERQIPETYGPAALPMTRIVEIQEVPTSTGRAVYPSVPKEAPNVATSSRGLEFLDLNLVDPYWVESQDGMGQSTLQANDTSVLETEDPTRQGGYVDPDEDKRGKIAEVFKNTARLYLYSVIFGSDPLVPKTRRAVQATIRSLEVCSLVYSQSFSFVFSLLSLSSSFGMGHFNWPIGSVVYRTGQLSSTGS
jgi:hypothetical protein